MTSLCTIITSIIFALMVVGLASLAVMLWNAPTLLKNAAHNATLGPRDRRTRSGAFFIESAPEQSLSVQEADAEARAEGALWQARTPDGALALELSQVRRHLYQLIITAPVPQAPKKLTLRARDPLDPGGDAPLGDPALDAVLLSAGDHGAALAALPRAARERWVELLREHPLRAQRAQVADRRFEAEVMIDARALGYNAANVQHLLALIEACVADLNAAGDVPARLSAQIADAHEAPVWRYGCLDRLLTDHPYHAEARRLHNMLVSDHGQLIAEDARGADRAELLLLRARHVLEPGSAGWVASHQQALAQLEEGPLCEEAAAALLAHGGIAQIHEEALPPRVRQRLLSIALRGPEREAAEAALVDELRRGEFRRQTWLEWLGETREVVLPAEVLLELTSALDTKTITRVQALLGRSWDARFEGPVLRGLSHPEAAVALGALALLGEHGSTECHQAIARQMRHSNRRVREAAQHASDRLSARHSHLPRGGLSMSEVAGDLGGLTLAASGGALAMVAAHDEDAQALAASDEAVVFETTTRDDEAAAAAPHEAEATSKVR